MEDAQTQPGAAARRARPRDEPAPALRRLVESHAIESGGRVLCYGCGSGADVDWLKMRRFDVYGYDPYPAFGYSVLPAGLFHAVTLIYAMNRLKTDAARRQAIARIAALLRPGGMLYVVSRHAPALAAASGHAGRDGLLAWFASLAEPGQFDDWSLLPPAPGDSAALFAARRGGTYRPRAPFEWIDGPEAIAAVCAQLERAPAIGLDVETTLGEPKKLCTIQIAVPGRTYILDALAMPSLDPVKRVLESPLVEKVIHNALFEEQVFGRRQVKIVNVFDTLNAARKKHKGAAHHKLGDVCERELGIYLDKSNQTSDWTLRPLRADQLEYAAIDAEVLIELHRRFKPPKPPEALTLFDAT